MTLTSVKSSAVAIMMEASKQQPEKNPAVLKKDVEKNPAVLKKDVEKNPAVPKKDVEKNPAVPEKDVEKNTAVRKKKDVEKNTAVRKKKDVELEQEPEKKIAEADESSSVGELTEDEATMCMHMDTCWPEQTHEKVRPHEFHMRST